MKHFLTILLTTCFSFNSKATIHEILVWDGYMQFIPNTLTVELGDTIQWLPLDYPSMSHTITSTNIPNGATSFDVIWEAPADTFFQYIPQIVGIYEYECTPHIMMNMIGNFEVIDTPNNIVENKKNTLLAYPNPTTDIIFIDQHFSGYDFKLFNMNNQLIKTGITENSMNIAYLKSGTYILIIYGDKPRTQKLIVQ